MDARRGGRSAFTLIELLITIAVLSIAMLLVIPSMAGTGVLRVQGVARTIVSDISFAQADAMAYQTRRMLWFGKVPQAPSEAGWSFVDGPGYAIAEVNGPVFDLSTDFLYAPDHPDLPLARDFSKGLEVEVGLSAVFGDPGEEGSDWLIFDELGGTAGGLTGPEPGPGGVILIESDLVTYTITIEPLTGRTTVDRLVIVEE
jgi:prepilin-type N-terminal cleavage/methylation domain-containing protein